MTLLSLIDLAGLVGAHFKVSSDFKNVKHKSLIVMLAGSIL